MIGNQFIHSIVPRSQCKEEQEPFTLNTSRTQSIKNSHKSDRIQEFNRFLAASAEREDCNLCFETFKDLLLSSARPDSLSYAFLEKSLKKVTNSSLILKFSKEVMEITEDREPTVINKILFILGKIGHWKAALQVFEDMKNNCRKMDPVTFNTVLSILGKHGEIDRMISEFDSMKELGYAPDYVTYNTLINSLKRFGRVDLCSMYLKEMVSREIKPDLLTYTAVMDSLGRTGHVGDAVGILEEMKAMHIHPSIYVFRGLVGNYKKVGTSEMAETLQEEIKSLRILDSREIEERKQLRKKRFFFRDWRLQ